MTRLLLAAVVLAAAPGPEPAARLPARVRRIVLHVPGGPSYARPEMRFAFLTPQGTQALWKSKFGAHWIVWTDGSIWPRHPRPGEAPYWEPPNTTSVPEAIARRLAGEARPVYSHVHRGNTASLGIEVSHSGRSADPFPPAQMRSLTWLLRALLEMSRGRLTPAAVVGHKDLDLRPAYVRSACERSGCPRFVDAEGRPFRRRVDPPESLFRALSGAGFAIPRPFRDGDAELRRTEALGPGVRPPEQRPR